MKKREAIITPHGKRNLLRNAREAQRSGVMIFPSACVFWGG